jgi:hypothetical protein
MEARGETRYDQILGISHFVTSGLWESIGLYHRSGVLHLKHNEPGDLPGSLSVHEVIKFRPVLMQSG